jgi:hypothetical protein
VKSWAFVLLSSEEPLFDVFDLRIDSGYLRMIGGVPFAYFDDTPE